MTSPKKESFLDDEHHKQAHPQDSNVLPTKSSLGLTDELSNPISVEKSSCPLEDGHQAPTAEAKSRPIPSSSPKQLLTTTAPRPPGDSPKPFCPSLKVGDISASGSDLGEQKTGLKVTLAPIPSASDSTLVNRPITSPDESVNERQRKKPKLESPTFRHEHSVHSHPPHSPHRKPSDQLVFRPDGLSEKSEKLPSDLRDPISPSQRCLNALPSAPHLHDHPHNRAFNHPSSGIVTAAPHGSRGAPSSPVSYKVPFGNGPTAVRPTASLGSRPWTSHKMPVDAVSGSGSPVNPVVKEPPKHGHPEYHELHGPERFTPRSGFSPKSHLSSIFTPPTSHAKTHSDSHTPSHVRGGSISGPTLNTPASEVFRSPLPLSIPITIPPPAPPPPPPNHLKPTPGSTLPNPPIIMHGSSNPRAPPSGSLSPTAHFKPGPNPAPNPSSSSPMGGNQIKAIPVITNNSSLRKEVIGGSSTPAPLNGFNGSVNPPPPHGAGPLPNQFRVNNYPSVSKPFVGYTPAGVAGPHPSNPGGPILGVGPPPPPPVMIDRDFERAQRMMDVCPGLSQEIAKLRSTRNSSMLSSHLSSEVSVQKATMDLNWQTSELKTMTERRKVAESQLEKYGGGISLAMGF